MRDEKVNILDVLLWAALTLGSAGLFLISLNRVGTVVLVGTGGLTLLFAWVLLIDVRRGVRPPTRWEWFKAGMNLRPVVVFLLGIALLLIAVQWMPDFARQNREIAGMILVALVLGFCILMVYTIFRAPQRWESDEAYRKRIKWRDWGEGEEVKSP